ncbi:hypothetical protein ES707_14769 [subsurface metagenome]
MELNIVVTDAARLARWAKGALEARRPDKAKASLVELRKLLDAEPELEAGGAPEETPGPG